MTEAAATPSARARIDKLALATFILASLWLLGLGSLVALYLGRRSLQRASATPGLAGRTLAWAGIAVAIYGIALAAIWVGLSLIA